MAIRISTLFFTIPSFRTNIEDNDLYKHFSHKYSMLMTTKTF